MPETDRQAALDAAVRLHQHLGIFLVPGIAREQTVADAELAIRRSADHFAAWLDGTKRLRLTATNPVDESAGAPGAPIQGVTAMQMNTGQKFSVTADTEDASGFDTPATIAWSIDNADVAVLSVSADTKTCEVVSGAPGSAVLTATVTSLDPPLSATLAVDVVPAGTATINLVAGDPVSE